MWRDRCLQLFIDDDNNSKKIAEKCGVSENTIKRIKKDPNVTIHLSTLEQIATGYGLTLQDLTNDTNTIVGTVKLEVLQEELNKAIDENKILLADKNLLEKEVANLTARLELTETKLLYCEKLLAVHEHYTKLKCE